MSMRSHIIWLSNEIPSVMFQDFLTLDLQLWMLLPFILVEEFLYVLQQNMVAMMQENNTECYCILNIECTAQKISGCEDSFPKLSTVIILCATVILRWRIPSQKSDPSWFVLFYHSYLDLFHFIEV